MTILFTSFSRWSASRFSKQGESVIFDPDKVKHGMENLSSTKNRYALVHFRAYPMSEWFKNFLYKEQYD